MSSVLALHKKYVRNTAKESIVELLEVFLCYLTFAVLTSFHAPCKEVYINTRVIKHLYDKRSAQEFDFILNNLISVMKYPNRIYKNKSGKRGQYCFVKIIDAVLYLCCIEIQKTSDDNRFRLEVVTAFIVTEQYLSSYELLWEWKGGGTIHRNAFVAK